jgi:hypothetical protein
LSSSTRFRKERERKEGFKIEKGFVLNRQRAWQKFLAEILTQAGARRNLRDECVYIWKKGEDSLIIGTHVDDLFSLFNEKGKVIRDRVMKALKEKMQIDDKGEINYALDVFNGISKTAHLKSHKEVTLNHKRIRNERSEWKRSADT